MSLIDEHPFLEQINQNPFNNINGISKGNNLDLILMEKDKEIISLSNINISLKNRIDQLQKSLKEKEIEINSLKSDLLSLNEDQKLKEEEYNLLKNNFYSIKK